MIRGMGVNKEHGSILHRDWGLGFIGFRVGKK